MAGTIKPPKAVIVTEPPRARWPWWVLGLVGWVASTFAVWHAARASLGPECARVQTQLATAHASVGRSVEELRELRARIAVLERGMQVSREAHANLQAELLAREEELAALRADINFYQRLVGGGAERTGLGVHSLRLQPSEIERVYGFTLTLSQNLERGRMAEGEVRISVEGLAEGRLQRLDWAELAGDAAEGPLRYGFRYFQQIDGSLALPEGFQPHRIRVRLVPDGRGNPIDHELSWAEARDQGVSNDVR